MAPRESFLDRQPLMSPPPLVSQTHVDGLVRQPMAGSSRPRARQTAPSLSNLASRMLDWTIPFRAMRQELSARRQAGRPLLQRSTRSGSPVSVADVPVVSAGEL